MTDAKLRQALAMREQGCSVSEISEVIGVSRATIYRHLEAAMGAEREPPG